MFVMVVSWGGWLGYSKAPGFKKTSFFWLGDVAGDMRGRVGVNLFEAESHLSQITQTKSCGLHALCASQQR